MSIQLIKSIRDFEITGKRVFMRLDFNVPLGEPDAEGYRHVEEDLRIQEALPTILYAIEKGAKVIIASHLGRPDGKVKPEFSLEPVAVHLATLLKDVPVTMADDCMGEGIELMAQNLPNGQIMVLENLRFHKGEEANEADFCRRLARLCDIYINDAFGTSHRKHASVYGLPSLLSMRGVGFLIEKEMRYLEPLVSNPKKPFYAVLGGSKVTDKIKTIDFLMQNLNGLCIGGAMAHAFWLAEGKTLPETAKKPKPEDVEAAKKLIAEAKRKEIPLLIPVDTNQGFDIGPKTVEKFAEFLSKAKTIFWNGPMGWFEKEEYAAGTFDLARRVAEMGAIKIVGGGDTVSAIRKSGTEAKFDHLSTGGGAVLEYLEGHGLPGIDILKSTQRLVSSPTLEIRDDE